MLLIIDKSLKNAKTVLDLFHFMGIVSSAMTPEHAVKEISNRYRAVLISNPENIPSADELIKTLHTYSLGAPIFALCYNPEKFKAENKYLSSLFDGILKEDIQSSDIFYEIAGYQKENKLPLIGDYKLSGIDASAFKAATSYFDVPLPFTKTETMILRYLIRAYPSPTKPLDILKYAFRPSRAPELSNIRTHISVMNKKFKSITGRNLIFSESGIGYTILTPEMMESKAAIH